jgi:hypothetical protein
VLYYSLLIYLNIIAVLIPLVILINLSFTTFILIKIKLYYLALKILYYKLAKCLISLLPEKLTLLTYLECYIKFLRLRKSDYPYLYLQINPLTQARICKAKV